MSMPGTIYPTTKPEERTDTRTERQPPYAIILHNDDVNTMEFVVAVLQGFFSMSREQATQVMLKVHREGMGVCGVYSKDIATTKVDQVIAYARKHQHPLQCVMEET